MSGSTIAIIYGIVLTLFFVLLVVLTITLIASKKKKNGDEDTDYADEAYEDADYADEAYEDADYADEGYEDADYADEAYEDADYADEDYEDADYEDSAFTEDENIAQNSTIEDSAFTENENIAQNSTIEDSAFTDNDINDTVEDEQVYEHVSSIPSIINDNDIEDAEPVLNDAVGEQMYKASDDSAFADDNFSDSAFSDSAFSDSAFVVDSAFSLNESIKEAEALREALTEEIQTKKADKASSGKARLKSNVPSTDDFYWYNKMDVKERPSYKSEEMYYHHFNIAKDCIEELLMEMYDCALVRTEEIKYIAYGIEPRAVSMKEILTSGNRNYMTQAKLKEPSTQDLVKIYEKWCGYVDKLFEKIYVHADEYTINEIRSLLYEFGRSDVDVLIEGM